MSRSLCLPQVASALATVVAVAAVAPAAHPLLRDLLPPLSRQAVHPRLLRDMLPLWRPLLPQLDTLRLLPQLALSPPAVRLRPRLDTLRLLLRLPLSLLAVHLRPRLDTLLLLLQLPLSPPDMLLLHQLRRSLLAVSLLLPLDTLLLHRLRRSLLVVSLPPLQDTLPRPRLLPPRRLSLLAALRPPRTRPDHRLRRLPHQLVVHLRRLEPPLAPKLLELAAALLVRLPSPELTRPLT